jgi:hypothetical protein
MMGVEPIPRFSRERILSLDQNHDPLGRSIDQKSRVAQGLENFVFIILQAWIGEPPPK